MRNPTPIQHHILRRMAEGWTVLYAGGATMLLRDNRDVTRRTVAVRTAQALSDGGWIARTYVAGRGRRWKITDAGKRAVEGAR